MADREAWSTIWSNVIIWIVLGALLISTLSFFVNLVPLFHCSRVAGTIIVGWALLLLGFIGLIKLGIPFGRSEYECPICDQTFIPPAAGYENSCPKCRKRFDFFPNWPKRVLARWERSFIIGNIIAIGAVSRWLATCVTATQ